MVKMVSSTRKRYFVLFYDPEQSKHRKIIVASVFQIVFSSSSRRRMKREQMGLTVQTKLQVSIDKNIHVQEYQPLKRPGKICFHLCFLPPWLLPEYSKIEIDKPRITYFQHHFLFFSFSFSPFCSWG